MSVPCSHSPLTINTYSQRLHYHFLPFSFLFLSFSQQNRRSSSHFQKRREIIDRAVKGKKVQLFNIMSSSTIPIVTTAASDGPDCLESDLDWEDILDLTEDVLADELQDFNNTSTSTVPLITTVTSEGPDDLKSDFDWTKCIDDLFSHKDVLVDQRKEEQNFNISTSTTPLNTTVAFEGLDLKDLNSDFDGKDIVEPAAMTLSRSTWTPEEDKKLVKCIGELGGQVSHGTWFSIPRTAGLRRTKSACYNRWKDYLNHNLKKGPFTEQEDNRIIKLQKESPNKWSWMANDEVLRSRSHNDIKNRWINHLIEKKQVRAVVANLEKESTRDSKDSAHYDGESVSRAVVLRGNAPTSGTLDEQHGEDGLDFLEDYERTVLVDKRPLDKTSVPPTIREHTLTERSGRNMGTAGWKRS